jgi:excisionase family DNA binding protein
LVEHELMTIKEVADYLRVSEATIYRLMKTGELPSIKFSAKRFTRVRRSNLMDYIERHSTGGRTQS